MSTPPGKQKRYPIMTPTMSMYFQHTIAGLEKLHLPDEKISKLHNILDKAREQDQSILKLRAEYASLHNSYVPVIALAPEILRRIFEFALGSPSASPRRRSSVLTEVMITHVCRRWRNIALDDTWLWSKFSYGISPAGLAKNMTRLDAYLTRSDRQPLVLFFDFTEVCLNSKTMELVKATFPHVARWRRFNLLCRLVDKINLAEAFSELADCSTPLLEEFALSQRDRSGSFTNDLQPCIFRGGAPNLALLRLNEINPIPFIPPISSLTSVQVHNQAVLNGPLPYSLFRLLLKLPVLSSLSLHNIDFEMPPSSDDLRLIPDIVMEHVTHIRISYCETAVNLLPIINAPKLHSLTIFGRATGDAPRAMINQPLFPSLHTFISDFNFYKKPQPQWNLIRRTKEIKRLILVSDNPLLFLDHVIPAFEASDDDDLDKVLWPRLREVVLNVPDSILVDEVSDFLDFFRDYQFVIKLDARIMSYWKKGEVKQLKQFKILSKRSRFVEWDFSALVAEQAAWPGEGATACHELGFTRAAHEIDPFEFTRMRSLSR